VPYAPKEVINSPVVETLTFANCNETEDKMRAMVEMAKDLAGCNGVASGFTLNEIDSEKAFVAAIGWNCTNSSKEADNSYMGGLNPEVHHVNFNFPIKGFGGL
jgi:hypothetical protein